MRISVILSVNLVGVRVYKMRWFFFFLVLISRCWSNEPVFQIPAPDREVLEAFFQRLFRESPCAYTLFGNKPMSIACYLDPLYAVGRQELEQSLFFEKGWKIWHKYNHLFPNDSFVLKKVSDETRDLLKTSTIYLINKRSVLQAIRDNTDVFGELDPEEVLANLCDPKTQISLEEDQLGILLGFGRKNAVLFNRWAKILHYLEMGFMPPFDPNKRGLDQIEISWRQLIKIQRPNWKIYTLAPTTFPSYAEEFNSIQNKRTGFHLPGSNRLWDYLDTPVFIDHGNDPELYNTYIQTRNSLRKIFNGNQSFLEIVLNQWTIKQ